MSDESALAALAAESFSLDALRDGQLAAMSALAEGRDVLAVMPTGYGKSATYQVAALYLHQQQQKLQGRTGGPAVVVSPLIALQEDQLEGLNRHLGEGAAVAVNSAHSDADVEAAWDAVESGKTVYLFLAPEQLAKQETVERIARADLTLLVVDEAHCVSSWGHDFRPDYLNLGNVRESLGNPPVAALTATASPPVRDEIVERLGMQDPLILVRGFDRPNISLEVVRHHEDKAKRKAVLSQVASLTTSGQKGLVYAATRKDTEKYAAKLVAQGIRAEAYHAGRSASEREHIHEQFLADDLDVVVATTAFGMGIDKPNVRFVVHADIPESLDAYYQEIGRGGRDGDKARAVLHYRSEDLGLRKFFGTHAPDQESLLAVLKVLKNASAPATKKVLAELTGFPPRRVTALVNQLEEADAVKVGKRGVRLASKAKLRSLVAHAVELAEARQRVDHSRLTMMRAYAETDSCRRQFLLGYFGEELAKACGNCGVCTEAANHPDVRRTGKETPDAGASPDPFPLQSAVIHKEWGPGLVMRHEDDVITVLFEHEGYKTLSRSTVMEHELLRPA
ncbi:RecQ family ATP-dependent DNA helicase [Paenarthrobacter ureafaciens]|uniref:RecQ family ATP-dependent DNA helicase n=1 Tax=Paenarthrobacter TaxID=1742992 RepID=UPI00222E3676|nr:RecQ family ATP-dependent DNA helicase [Paenarthrobacter sp. PAE-2]MCW3768402.1 RecQ family ATP-dependent DNA helicase [Paenarthrobacter sp. PAE-2]